MIKTRGVAIQIYFTVMRTIDPFIINQWATLNTDNIQHIGPYISIQFFLDDIGPISDFNRESGNV